MTRHAFPYIPRDSNGDWLVLLPGQASIGEVLVYATPTSIPPDPWDTPVAPAGVLVTAAVTHVVPAAWIRPAGDSAQVPYYGPWTQKLIFRTKQQTPPTATPSRVGHSWYWADYNNSGTYSAAGLLSDNPLGQWGAWAWYGPGATTSDGLVIPPDAAAMYVQLNSQQYWTALLGPPIVTQDFYTEQPPFSWWQTNPGATLNPPDPATQLILHQRFDDEATHTLPLLPYQLPP